MAFTEWLQYACKGVPDVSMVDMSETQECLILKGWGAYDMSPKAWPGSYWT